MIVQCMDCGKSYDDVDHLTFCPHAWFPPGPGTVIRTGQDELPPPPTVPQLLAQIAENTRQTILLLQAIAGAMAEYFDVAADQAERPGRRG